MRLWLTASLAASAGLGFGQEPKADVVRRIVATWQARQAQIKTIRCSAKVDSFYPRGYLSEMLRAGPFARSGAHPLGTQPGDDTSFTNEACSWDIDYNTLRIRKDSQVTICGVGQQRDTARFERYHELDLLINGEYRVFRSKQTRDSTDENATVLDPKAFLYAKGAPMPLTFTDLPLLWLHGAVSGAYPSSANLRLVGRPTAFTYHAEAQWRDHPCLLLSTTEQQDAHTVREFWVGRQPPYPIYLCRAREHKKVFWQLEAEYRDDHGSMVPTEWTYTEYDQGTGARLFHKETYRVQEILLNVDLADTLFRRALDPGMTVFSVEQNKALEVNQEGRLVPLGTTRRELKWTDGLFWAGLALTIAAIGLYIGRWARSRRSTSERM